MQQALERALDRAQCVIENAQQRPPKRKHSSSGEKSLSEKLYDIYVEECEKEPEVTEELRSNVNLLEKLVMRESLPCLVVNLHPGEGGYSLMLKGKDGSYSETIRLPYEERELLEYLDAEELPPVLVGLLEKSQINIFHCGCVIAEIRDYRQPSNMDPPAYQSRHILLRPTMQTLACDVEAITSDNQKWTQEDKLLLESQLILATAEPLCLDPSISVACTANRLLYNRQKMNTGQMKRNLRKYSTPSLSQQQELSHHPPPPDLRVLTSCHKSKESEAAQQYDLNISGAGNHVDMGTQRPCDLAVPSEVDVEKYAEEKSSVNYDDSQPTVWPAHEVEDDSVFEREAGNRYREPKLILMRSPNDPLISGKEMSPKKVICERQMSLPHSSRDDHSDSFMPGSKTDAGRVVSQSEELVQKKIDCPAKMSHSSSGSASLSPLSSGKETEQPKIMLVQSSVQGKEVRRQPPLIIIPSSSGKRFSGSTLTPQPASSFHKSPSPAPAFKPPSLSQKSSVEVKRASTLPAAALSTAGSSPRALAAQVTVNPVGVKVIKVVSPVPRAQALGRGANPLLSSATQTIAPAVTKSSQLPSGGQPPNAPQATTQVPSQAGVRVIFKGGPGAKPLTVLQFPQGSVILNNQLPPQQPQQQLYQVITQQPPQQPSASPQLPVSQGSSAQGSASQKLVISAQQAVVINIGGSFLHPEPLVVSTPGAAQRRPGQSLPQQRVQLSSTLQQPLKQQPQQPHQWPLKQPQQHLVQQTHQQQPHQGPPEQPQQQPPPQPLQQPLQQPRQRQQPQHPPQQPQDPPQQLQHPPQQLQQQQPPQQPQQQQQQQQVQQLRILQPPVAVVPAAAQTAQPPQGQQTAGPSQGKMSRGPPPMPKS